jgi:hypothetical protein
MSNILSVVQSVLGVSRIHLPTLIVILADYISFDGQFQ